MKYFLMILYQNLVNLVLVLFASNLNKKCKNYISWGQDPEASNIDAFTVNWSEFFFYAFPPFSLVLKTIAKILEDKATGIIVVPFWENQPWFPLFKRLFLNKPIVFYPNKK